MEQQDVLQRCIGSMVRKWFKIGGESNLQQRIYFNYLMNKIKRSYTFCPIHASNMFLHYNFRSKHTVSALNQQWALQWSSKVGADYVTANFQKSHIEGKQFKMQCLILQLLNWRPGLELLWPPFGMMKKQISRNL